MIEHPDELIPHFLEICPNFRPVWDKYLAYWEGEEKRGIFIDLSEFAEFLVDSFSDKDTECFPKVFSFIETVLSQHEETLQGIITWGLFESIQNISGNRGINPNVFEVWLGSQGLIAWTEGNKFWKGELDHPPIDKNKSRQREKEQLIKRSTQKLSQSEAEEIVGQCNHFELPANLDKCDMTGLNFSSWDLSDAKGFSSIFNKAHLEHTKFDHADLENARFIEAFLTNASFVDANLTGAIF